MSLESSLRRFINFYDGRNRFRVSLKRDNHKCLPPTADTSAISADVTPECIVFHPPVATNVSRANGERIFAGHFLRSSVRMNFTIGTPVRDAEKHLLISVERQAIPLNVKNSDNNVSSCLAFHQSASPGFLRHCEGTFFS